MGEANGYLPFPKGFATAAIHVGQEPEQWDSMAVVTPLVLSSTFKQYGPGDFKKYEYGRSGNPTREALEKCLASLENAKYCLSFASGLGAITAVVSLLKQGDHIISTDDVYGGTNRFFNKIASKFGIEITFVECCNINAYVEAIKPNTKIIWTESPTNPTLQVCDIRELSKVAKKHNLLLAVDNTFLTPYLQRPLDLGADIVVHSLTKYINGHSDVIMGSVMINNEQVKDELQFYQNAMGIVPSPFDCYQVLRSLKTLALRMQQHMKSGLIIGKFLEQHPKVEKVLHPGLPSHPQFELFKTQTSGPSGMVAFYIKGNIETSSKFLRALKLFVVSGSLGGPVSSAALPMIMIHSSFPKEMQRALGITDNLLRLTIGLEDVEHLISDLEQALDSC